MEKKLMLPLFCLAAIVMLVCLPVSASAGPYNVPGPVPDTGQTKCYDTNGSVITCPSPGQDYYGQDAQYNINPMSFTKLGQNGIELPDTATIADGWIMTRDNVTGMVWEVKQDRDGTKNYSNPHDADNTYTWYDPDPATNHGNAGTESDHDTLDFINALNTENFGGYSDWRMPSREELRSIVDYNTYNPAIDRYYFPDTGSDFYWSSTNDALYTNSAWGIYFHYGNDSYYKSFFPFPVRAVRGGQ